MPSSWEVERFRAPAAELHALDGPDDGRRRLWVLEPTVPAVVLGSTQPDDAVDRETARSAGVQVARRRSGGGAVWVAPGDPIWIDVLVPRADPIWDDDVGRSFLPIGRAWAGALHALGVDGAEVNERGMQANEWSSAVCFAGRGAGEVFVGDAKVVGMSQRRTRAGARFQCAVPRRWDPEPLRALLRPSPPAGVLDGCGHGVGHIPVDALVDHLAAELG